MKKIFLQLSTALFLLSLLTIGCSAQSDANVEDNTQQVKEEPGSGETNGYKLVWQDLFNGTNLDETNNWTVEVNGNGGGNSELQYYRRENITLGTEPVTGSSCLIITAKKESFSGKTCTSGRLTTSGKMSFKHGKVEARIKLPHTANGLWPAFWMLGADYSSVGWPKCGEIDMLEMGNVNGITRGTQDRYYSGWFHWGESWNNGSYPNWGKDATNATSIQDDFHLFTLIWDDNALKCYLDLDKNPTATPYVEMAINGADIAGNAAHYFHKKFFVILNLAIGGNFTQIWDINKITALNNGDAKMYIDFVKVYQKGDATEEFSGQKYTKVSTAVATPAYQLVPVSGTSTVAIRGAEVPATVNVMNTCGQTLLTVSQTNTLDLGRLKSDVYLIEIIGANHQRQVVKYLKP